MNRTTGKRSGFASSALSVYNEHDLHTSVRSTSLHDYAHPSLASAAGYSSQAARTNAGVDLSGVGADELQIQKASHNIQMLTNQSSEEDSIMADERAKYTMLKPSSGLVCKEDISKIQHHQTTLTSKCSVSKFTLASKTNSSLVRNAAVPRVDYRPLAMPKV